MPSKYALGYKYCSRCRRYELTAGYHCPTCGKSLRAKGRGRRRVAADPQRINPDVVEKTI